MSKYIVTFPAYIPENVIRIICDKFPEYGTYTQQDIDNHYSALKEAGCNITNFNPIEIGTKHVGKVNAATIKSENQILIVSTYIESENEIREILKKIITDCSVEKVPEPSFVFETSSDDIEPTVLTEAIVNKFGNKWEFHLSDPDPWPSVPHGHDNEKGKKLNPFTGEIFNIKTRKITGRLKPRKLSELQLELKSKKGFEDIKF